MQILKYVFWEEEGNWLGCLQDYPDYWTQGDTLDDLKEHLLDLYVDLTGGHPLELRNQSGRELLEFIGESAAAETAPFPLHDGPRQELERRLDAYETNPKGGSSWEEVKARLRKKDTADG